MLRLGHAQSNAICFCIARRHDVCSAYGRKRGGKHGTEFLAAVVREDKTHRREPIGRAHS